MKKTIILLLLPSLASVAVIDDSLYINKDTCGLAFPIKQVNVTLSLIRVKRHLQLERIAKMAGHESNHDPGSKQYFKNFVETKMGDEIYHNNNTKKMLLEQRESTVGLNTATSNNTSLGDTKAANYGGGEEIDGDKFFVVEQYFYPFVVPITMGGATLCSAVLINNYYLVVAAHCVHDKHPTGLSFRIGTSDEVYRIKDINVHIFYNSGRVANDIALMAIDRFVPFEVVDREGVPRYRANAVCVLPFGNTDLATLFNVLSKVVNVVGFKEVGGNKMLLEVRRTIQGTACDFGFKLPPRVWCVKGSTAVDKLITQIGSVALMTQSRTSLLLGLATEKPGIYTDVKGHLRWIDDILTRKHGVSRRN